MVLMELSVVPLNKGESVSPWVARCVDLIDRSGLDYELHASGTIVEGSLDQLIVLLRQCIEEVTRDCDRVICHAKFDHEEGESGRLKAQVKSVENELGRPLRTGASA